LIAICVLVVASVNGVNIGKYEEIIDRLENRLQIAEEKIEKLTNMLQNQATTARVNDLYAPLQGAGYINVANAPYNAKGDGVTDDSTAFQNALTFTGNSGGGIVFVPAATYYIASNLVVPSNTQLIGIAHAPYRSWGNASRAIGTTLLAVANSGNASSSPFIYLSGPNAGVEGLAIFYPNQQQTNPPIQYSWSIQGSGDDLFVKDALLVNPYMGIDFGTYSCPRHYIERVYGQPLYIGIKIDQTYDIGRIKTIHFWPFWSSNQALLNYQNLNAITFQFFRSDWEVVEDVFSWGYNTGMQFYKSTHGCLNGQFTNINFDNVDIGLDIQNSQSWGIFISNLNLANADGVGNNRTSILGRSGGEAFVIIRGFSAWGSINQAVNWANSGMISVTNSIFQQWNSSNAVIGITNGRGIIRGNYFGDNIGTAIYIGPATDRAMIVDNELVGNKVINDGGNTLIANNQT